MKIWVESKLVLDSTPSPEPTNRFRSQPVSLTAGKKTEIRVEIALDPEQLVKNIDQRDVQFGAGLLWESPKLASQLVPASSFSPPEGYGQAGATGLKGEYFEDPKLEKLVDTRLDPAIDMFWTRGAVVSHPDRFQIVLAEVWPRSQNEVLAGRLPPDELVPLMRLPQRREWVIWLAGQEDVLKRIDERTMARLVSHIYFLPGKEHLALLKAWGGYLDSPVLAE